MTKPKVEVLPIEQAAAPDLSNVNKHTQKGRGLLENELRKRGAFRSIASAGKDTETPVVYAGNLTLETAADIGIKEVVNVYVDGSQLVNVVRTDLTPGSAEAIALGISDNEIGKTSYNPDIDVLAALAAGDNAILSALRAEDKTFDRMIEGMGLKEETHDAPADVDRAAELLEKWKVQPGDLWQIGEHRLICGDCTDAATVARVMDGERARVTVTDPPFSVRDDEWDKFEDFFGFTLLWFTTAIGVSELIAAFFPDKFLPLLAKVADKAGVPFRRSLVWRKPAGSQMAGASKDGYWYDFEFVQVYGEKTTPNLKNTKMSVFEYRTITGQEHGAEKPVETYQEVLEGYTVDGDIAYEPFCGTGTNLVACENLRRRCRAIEISPAYVAVALERMSAAFPHLEIKKL